MGAFLDWLGGSGTGLLGNVAGSVVSGLFGNKQNKQNIQAQQAENAKDRAFNAEQAQLGREWQEMMYNKYESPVAQAQARRQAGLPIEASSMQVGSSSTASAGSSSLPAPASPWTGLGESIKQLPFIRQQIKQQKLETALKQEQLLQSISNTTIKSIEAANSAESAKLALEEAYERIEGLRIDNEHKDVLRKQAQLAFDKQKDAYDKGINEYVDQHNEVMSRINKAQQEIENLKVDYEVKSFALETSKLYDRKFLALDYEERKKAVEEFLNTSDVRISLYNAQKGFARLAMNAAERADALESITNETERIIAQSILDAASDGVSSYDAVLLKYLTDDPASTLSALSSILKPLQL